MLKPHSKLTRIEVIKREMSNEHPALFKSFDNRTY